MGNAYRLRKLREIIRKLDIPSDKKDMDDPECVRWVMSNWESYDHLHPVVAALFKVYLRMRLNDLTRGPSSG